MKRRFKIGDKVIYEGEIYTIIKPFNWNIGLVKKEDYKYGTYEEAWYIKKDEEVRDVYARNLKLVPEDIQRTLE